MPFTYDKPANVEGEFVKGGMEFLASKGFIMKLRDGFLHPEPNNTFRGEVKPRNVIAGTIEGDAVKVGVSSGYSRDALLEQAAAYLRDHPEESIDIKFVSVPGTKYIDIEVA